MHAGHVVTCEDAESFVCVFLGGKETYGVKASHAVPVISGKIHAFCEVVVFYPDQENQE